MRFIPRSLSLPAVFIVVLALAVPLGVASPAEAIDTRSRHEIRNKTERRINRARVRRDHRRLRVGGYLQRRAQDHACDMARRRSVYHDPNLAGEITRKAKAWGENVARTSARNAARRVHRMFMNSYWHRRNIVRKRWNRMGVGVCKRGRYTYIVERFIDL